MGFYERAEEKIRKAWVKVKVDGSEKLDLKEMYETRGNGLQNGVQQNLSMKANLIS